MAGDWTPIQFINASSQSETLTTPVSPEPLYVSYGSREEEPRHRPSTDAVAGGDLRVIEYGPRTH
jgi:hypothetical protein